MKNPLFILTALITSISVSAWSDHLSPKKILDSDEPRFDCESDNDCVDQVEFRPGCSHYYDDGTEKYTLKDIKVCGAYRRSELNQLQMISCTVSWPCRKPEAVFCFNHTCKSK